MCCFFFFFKQKTAYEMRISDWSSDVCSSDLQREHYVGTWLPEPQCSDGPTPEQMAERADDVSVAFLTLLERLTPEARAAFLLREVFDADYDEVARTIGKSEAACRQLVHRAKEIGRAHVCTPITNATIVCRLLLVKKKT